LEFNETQPQKQTTPLKMALAQFRQNAPETFSDCRCGILN
jgi:hypothetical protein